MAKPAWRVILVTTVPIVTEVLDAALRQYGHQPVAVISARRKVQIEGRPAITDETAPAGIDILLPHRRHNMEALIRACSPDLLISWGFPWKIPAAALAVPRLGAINCHPAMLPRHRGPIPLAWAIRSGDDHYGITWHRMDAELDTGPILAQAPVPMEEDDFEIEVLGPRLGAVALNLLPGVLERIAADDPGDPQSEQEASWGDWFGADYARVDWSWPAKAIHDQVRAWRFAMGSPVTGPVAELDGSSVVLTRTSLRDPGDGSTAVETGDGPIWVRAYEPMPDGGQQGP